MNHDKISELYEMAQEWSYEKYSKRETGYTREYWASYKLAELIVRECLSIVDDAERGGDNEIWDNAVKFIRKDIKEHFGVE